MSREKRHNLFIAKRLICEAFSVLPSLRVSGLASNLRCVRWVFKSGEKSDGEYGKRDKTLVKVLEVSEYKLGKEVEQHKAQHYLRA